MAPRYERVREQDEDEDRHSPAPPTRRPNYVPPPPNSPPPAFESRSNSPAHDDPSTALVDSFDSPSDDEDDDNDMRNASRGINGNNSNSNASIFRSESTPLVPATIPTPVASSASRRAANLGQANDGVFANISAKPTSNADKPAEEHPPSYEQAAADATPPYWETTIMAPGMSFDDVFIDGLPVGSVFAFVWNALVSLSFQFVGFLLTYLLHTTHAAKNGSRAGLGITLVQYGFYMRAVPPSSNPADSPDASTPETYPPDPNSYDFPTSGLPSDAVAAVGDADSLGKNEWLSYVLMVVGWFILIRAISDFLRARRTEQVVLASPDRGLGVAVVADNEHPEASV